MFHLQRSGWRDLYQLIMGLQSLNQLLAQPCSFHDTPWAQSFEARLRNVQIWEDFSTSTHPWLVLPLSYHSAPPPCPAPPPKQTPHPSLWPPFQGCNPSFLGCRPPFRDCNPSLWSRAAPIFWEMASLGDFGETPTFVRLLLHWGWQLGSSGGGKRCYFGIFSVNCFNLLVPEADQTGQPSGWHHFHKCNPHLAQIFFSPLLVFRNSSSC